MTSSMSKRKEVLAGLKAGYIFILLPFIVLTMLKVFHDGGAVEILLASDWSLAACIIFGQNAANLTKAALSSRKGIQTSSFMYYFSRRLVGFAVALVLYILMQLEPNLWVGTLQLVIFTWASVRYFTDGAVSAMLKEEA